MTPCTAGRSPDFDKLVEKAKELVRVGMSAVVYCGSMGDWPLLTNEQRMEGVERLVAAGINVVVGTGAVNTATAVAIAAHAQKVGAHGLMVIPRLLSRGTVPAAQKAHFKAVLSAGLRTGDIWSEGTQRVGTRAMGDAVVAALSGKTITTITKG